MVQTYEGALTETHNILNRIKTLATQSANGTYDDQVDRAAVELEYEQLIEELDDIADTDFNNVKLLDGTIAEDYYLDLYYVGDETAGSIAARLAEFQAAVAPLAGMNAITDAAAANALTVVPGVRSDLQDILDNVPDNDATAAVRRSLTNSLNLLDVIEKRTKVILAGTITDANELDRWRAFVGSNAGIIRGMADFAAGTDGTDTKLLEVLNDSESFVTALKDSETDGTLSIIATDSRKIGLSKASLVSVIRNGRTSTIMPLLDKIEPALNLLQQQTAKLWVIRDNVKDKTETAEMLDTAIDALNKQKELVLKVSDVIMAVANDPNSDASITDPNKKYSKQVDLLLTGIDNIANTTAYNGVKLLDGSFTDQLLKYEDFSFGNPDGLALQVGARSKDLKEYDFDYSGVWRGDNSLQTKAIGRLAANTNATARGLGLVTSFVNLGSQTKANSAIDKIDNAINKVSMIRATFGSVQNRLEHKVDNLNQTNENLTSAESRIRDTDMADSMMEFSKHQILSESSQSMLSQANSLPQGALSLLQ
jgi:flagellin